MQSMTASLPHFRVRTVHGTQQGKRILVTVLTCTYTGIFLHPSGVSGRGELTPPTFYVHPPNQFELVTPPWGSSLGQMPMLLQHASLSTCRPVSVSRVSCQRLGG